ncbi:MAG: hypothetical protein IT289_10200 [Oligoflexia bacterium]|nr:hypothetical protein [Oligoflexia bacterium]
MTVLALLFVKISLYSSLSFGNSGPAYEALSARAKLQHLWGNVVSSVYSGRLPTKAPNLLKLLKCSFLMESFTTVSDELPANRGREKAIHTYGSVAQISFRPTNQTKYTGLFRTGAIGLARASLAVQGTPFTPGMGLKFLVDGRPSENLQIMYSLEGQGENQNFFANEFSNIVEPPKSLKLKALGFFFGRAAKALGKSRLDNERTITLSQMAAVEANGTSVSQPVAPYQLIFRPTAEVQMNPHDRTDVRERLALFKPGVVLYQVFARESVDGPLLEVGALVLESSFVASAYGDQNLFFKHPLKK